MHYFWNKWIIKVGGVKQQKQQNFILSSISLCFKIFFPVPYKIHVKNILKNYEKIRIKPSEYVKAYVSSFNPSSPELFKCKRSCSSPQSILLSILQYGRSLNAFQILCYQQDWWNSSHSDELFVVLMSQMKIPSFTVIGFFFWRRRSFKVFVIYDMEANLTMWQTESF